MNRSVVVTRHFYVGALVLIVTCYAVLTYRRNGVWQDEWTLWNDVVKKSPAKARPYIGRGSGYMKRKNTEAAFADFNKALAMHPGHTNGYFTRGKAYQEIGNYESALRDLRTFIFMAPKQVKGYLAAGEVLFHMGRYEEAMACAEEALRLRPDSAAAFNLRGTIHFQTGQSEEALADFNRVVSISRYYAEAYGNRGAIRDQVHGDLAGARRDYDRALQLNPELQDARANRGNWFMKQGKWREALADYEHVAEVPKYRLDTLQHMGFAWLNLGVFDRAISNFSSALEMDETLGRAYYYRAIAHVYKKNFVQARADMQKAESLGVDVAKLKVMLEEGAGE